MKADIIGADVQRAIEANISAGWTPYFLEILLHHYSSSAPFPRCDARAYGPAIDALQLEGLLDMRKRITVRGATFIGMLLRTPLPPRE